MIAILEGTVIERDISSIVLQVHGVGYQVNVTTNDNSRVQTGDSVVMYIAENIKEDAHDLYGFFEKTKRELYGQLVSVNGVGPKAAMSILSVSNEQEIRQAIANGDIKLLTSANGVGKKVAERVVVDLKNKVGMIEGANATSFLQSDVSIESDDAVQALMALGFSLSDAKLALIEVDPSLPLEDRVREALKRR